MNRDSRGFSLMEMIVVVAIVGIIATIGASSFESYSVRARTSEAKIGLAAIYTAERSFYGTQFSYTMCLLQIGFRPAQIPNYYYIGAMGMMSMGCGPAGGMACSMFDYTPPGQPCNCTVPTTDALGFHTDCAWDRMINIDGSGLPVMSWGNTKNTFVFGAIGTIKSGKLDTWTINEQKVLSRVSVGE